jgi:AbrB family looped-hinge helix DNA binding protein
MNSIQIQQRGIITLPKKLRDALGLSEGQVLSVEHRDGKIILEPQSSKVDTQLANDIRQGIADIKSGRFIEFSTTKEFHKKLASYED